MDPTALEELQEKRSGNLSLAAASQGGMRMAGGWMALLTVLACADAQTPGPDDAPSEKTPVPPPPRPDVQWTRDRIAGLAAPDIAPRDIELLIPTGVAPPEGGWPSLVVLDGQHAFNPRSPWTRT